MFVLIPVNEGILSKSCFLRLLLSSFAEVSFDGPDDRIKDAPFEFLKNVAHRSFIVELPGEKNAEGKGTCQDWKPVEEIKVDFWRDMKPDNESTKFLKTEVGADLVINFHSKKVNTNWPAKLTYKAMRILLTMGIL
jgi:hypothetical protein